MICDMNATTAADDIALVDTAGAAAVVAAVGGEAGRGSLKW